MRQLILAGTSVTALVLGSGLANAQAAPTTPASQSTPAPVPPTGAAAPAPAGNEIVVTASKREEKLKDVPTSITALSAATLQTTGAVTLRDVAKLAPGISERSTGGEGLGLVILRGLSTGATQTTATSAFYIDDTTITPNGFLSNSADVNPLPELAEIDHVEVLEGPQGTLYGASSLAGIIRYVTKKPDLDTFSGRVSSEFTAVDGGGAGGFLRGNVNIPIVTDHLAINATGFYRHAPGWADNVGTGTKNVNDSDIAGGRVAIRWKPTDRLTFDLTGLYQHIRNHGWDYVDLFTGGYQPVYGDHQYNMFQNDGSNLSYRLGTFNAAYETDIGTISYNLGLAKFHANYLQDDTATYLASAQASLPAGYPKPNYTDILTAPTSKKTGTELRFTSRRLGSFEFIAGAYYTHESTVTLNNVYGYTAPEQIIPGVPGTIIKTTTNSTYREYAFFGNATYYITDKLDITGGVRYSNDHEHDTTVGPGGVVFYAPRTGLVLNSNEQPLNYLGTLRWRVTPQISAYLRFATGFRPGGPQTAAAPPPGAQTVIKPDTTYNYEAGVKGSLLHGLVTFDASIYHIDWNDIQLTTQIQGFSVRGNAGQAQVDGVEAKAGIHPARGLHINGFFDWTHARITQISAATTASTKASLGDQLPLTPKFSGGITVDQDVPLSDTVKGSLGATVHYQAKNPAFYTLQVPAGQLFLPSFTTLDIRAGVEFGQYAVQFRIENLTNKVGYVNNVVPRPEGAGGEAVEIRPRTFAVGLSAKF